MNMLRALAVLINKDIDTSLNMALRSCLKRNPLSSQTPGSRERQRFCFTLLAFACSLQEYLTAESLVMSMVGISDLKGAARELWRTGRSFEGELKMVGSCVIELYSTFDSLIGDELVDGGNIRVNTSLLGPSITQLGSACSAIDWIHEAEILFSVLRSVTIYSPIADFANYLNFPK
jgi:hypothetical protein